MPAWLQVYRSIDRSCARLSSILETYQHCLFVYANEENSLSILLKECSKHDKSKAGKIMAITGKSLAQSSHQRIRLYMPLVRLHQEMETFHSRAVDDTTSTVEQLEKRRAQYRASLLWMKDVSERLDPDVYCKLDKFRRIQNQVRNDKKAFDSIQMDVVQKIDLLMASRCNLMNQILASYQSTLLETFEKNCNNFKSVEDMIKEEDIYEYEFKTLKQLNPLNLNETKPAVEQAIDLIGQLDEEERQADNLIDVDNDTNIAQKLTDPAPSETNDIMSDLESLFGIDELQGPKPQPSESENIMDQLESLFGRGGLQESIEKQEPESDDLMSQLDSFFRKTSGPKT